jgi:FtsP/CotA-like multicopper oxidase with cupredoxin domain
VLSQRVEGDLMGMMGGMMGMAEPATAVARDGQAETNPAWKDTVQIPTGSSYDLLVAFDSPGHWLRHCHIPEHMEAGMMAAFEVQEKA